MSFEQKATYLRDIIEVNPKIGLQKGKLYPFVDMAAIQEWQRDIPLEKVSARKFTGSGSKFEGGDVLLARITPCFENGKTAIAPKLHEPAHGSTEFIVVRPKHKSEHAYVYGLLRSPEFRSHAIQQMVGTSGRQRIPNEALLSYEAPLPDSAYRAQASKILSSIEDTCSSLRAENATFESIAQALFRSWFIRYDPVHAKAAGKSPEAMSPELAALFPSEFEDSKLGPLPKGWAASTLSSICSLNPESWTRTKHPHLVAYIDLASIKENVIAASETMPFESAPSRARRVLRKGDSLYGTVRPGNLSYGYIGANREGLTGSTGFAVLRPTMVTDAEFVYCAMTLKENIERLTRLAEGAAYPAVQPSIVHEQALALAPQLIREQFHKIASPLFELHAANNHVIQCLQQLRDHLLPNLISGKLSLKDVQEAVEDLIPA